MSHHARAGHESPVREAMPSGWLAHWGPASRKPTISEITRQVLASVQHAAAEGATDVEELVERLREDPDLGDIALENVQARLRTLILMTLANQDDALVLGTGDLSEKALGWSTYAG